MKRVKSCPSCDGTGQSDVDFTRDCSECGGTGVAVIVNKNEMRLRQLVAIADEIIEDYDDCISNGGNRARWLLSQYRQLRKDATT